MRHCAPLGRGGGQYALPPARPPALIEAKSTFPWERLWREGILPTRPKGAPLRAARRVLLALALAVAANPLLAAEGDADREDPEDANRSKETALEPGDAPTEAAETRVRPPVARDVFVPSEDISEDVEVPFPVDI